VRGLPSNDIDTDHSIATNQGIAGDLGNARNPGIVEDLGMVEDPGFAVDLGNAGDPGISQDLGFARNPGIVEDLGMVEDPGFAVDLGMVEDPGIAIDLGTAKDPGTAVDLGMVEDLGVWANISGISYRSGVGHPAATIPMPVGRHRPFAILKIEYIATGKFELLLISNELAESAPLTPAVSVCNRELFNHCVDYFSMSCLNQYCIPFENSLHVKEHFRELSYGCT